MNSDSDIISRAVPCPTCKGQGQQFAFACGACLYRERVGGKPARWFLLRDMAGGFPCGHTWEAEGGYIACARCEGTGGVPAWKTARAWERQDAKEAARRKLERSTMAKALVDIGPQWGQSRAAWRRMIGLLTPTCERRSLHTGEPCKKLVVRGRSRCALHGGLSTGPKTAEGRAAIVESNRRRAQVMHY